MSGRGLDHITNFYASHSNGIRVDKLPDYIYEMRSITRFGMNCSTHSQKRSDDFVNSFYDLVVGWDQITMHPWPKMGKEISFMDLRFLCMVVNILTRTSVLPARSRPQRDS